MFEKIIGNEKNKSILEKSIEIKKTSHSYLFWGIDGIGKKLIALEFAKKMLCLEPENKECRCKSCIEFESGSNPDFIMIEPEDGKIKIDQIRNLQRKVAEKPINSNKKVYIINDSDKMTTEAQNCLLKTLEEPPEYLTIILICSNEYSMLSTINSRCTRMHFDNLETNQIKKFLEEKYPETKFSEKIIKLSQGSIGKTLKLNQKTQLYENIENLFDSFKTKDLIDITSIAEEIYNEKEEINSVLEYMNILALEFSKKDIRYINAIDIIEDTKKRLQANSNYDMCVDNLLFNIWYLFQK